jgi:hypothetical protein
MVSVGLQASPQPFHRVDWEVPVADAVRPMFGHAPQARLRADMVAGAISGTVRSAIRAWEDSDYTLDPRPVAAEGLDIMARVSMKLRRAVTWWVP